MLDKIIISLAVIFFSLLTITPFLDNEDLGHSLTFVGLAWLVLAVLKRFWFV